MTTRLMLRVTGYALGLAIYFCYELFATAQEVCVRGKPEPMFRKDSEQIKSQKFNLVSAHEANELVNLSSGAQIRIRHWGCEYYAITLTIADPHRPVGQIGMAETLLETATWLRKLKPWKANLVFDFDLAAETLDQTAKENPNIAFEEAIPIRGDGTEFLQTQLTMTNPQPSKRAHQVIITFSKGPL